MKYDQSISANLLKRLIIALIMLIGTGYISAATITSTSNGGNWSTGSSWVGGAVPGTSDDVIIAGGATITVIANALCNTLTFAVGTSNLIVNSTFTLGVTNAVTLNNGTTAASASISGSGTLTCKTVSVGNSEPAKNVTATHTLTSQINTFIISYNLAINSYNPNGNKYANGVFSQTGGIITINGTISTANVGTCTYTLGSSSTLLLGGTTPFTLGTGTNTITLNGAGSTVNYNGAVQSVYGTAYNNLIISGSGTKTLDAATSIKSTLTVRAGTTLDLSTYSLGTTPPASVVLENGSTASTISGTGNLNLGGDVTVNNMGGTGSGALISCPVALGTATRTFNVVDETTTTPDLTISGIISGGAGGAVTKNGLGTLLLSNVNTYSGATTVNGGILKAGVATQAFGLTSAVILANTAGVVLDITGFANTIGSLTGGGTTGGNVTLGAATLTIGSDNTSPAAYAGVISGTGAISKSGTGTLILSGANTYTGTTTVSVGTLKLGSTSALGAASSGTTVNSGAVLDLNGINYSNAEPLTINGTGISNGGAIINTSTAATFAGLITLGSASSIIGGTGAINISNTGTITGATFSLTLGGAQGGTLASILGTTSGTLTKQDAGTWTLSGANTYTGTTTVNRGTLKAGVATQAFGLTSAVTLANTAGAALDITGFANTIGSLTGGGTTGGNVTLGAATLTIGSDNTSPAAFAGIISGTGAISKSGTGILILSGANTYTGATTINTGTLKLGVSSTSATAGSLGTTAGGTTVSSGAVLDLNGYSMTFADNEAITLNGTGLTTLPAGALTNTSSTPSSIICPITLGSASTITAAGTTGTLTCSGNVTGAFDLTLDGVTGSSGTMSGVISTPTSVIKNGAATWTLSGSNTFTGGLNINSGTIQLGSVNCLSASLPINLNGGTFGTGATTGFGDGVSTLALTNNSKIALGTGPHILTFASVSWTAGKTLTITGWTGLYNGTSGTAGKIKMGTNGLTLTQLAQIQFYNGSSNFPAILLSTGEVVPRQSNATDYFQSASTGNWSIPGNWQSSPDNSTWTIATLAPTSSAALITIQSPNTITVGGIQTASSVVIASGGTLSGGTTNMTVTGNWTNNEGTFTPGTGTVTFTGNASSINGTALTQVFNHIVVNKTSGQTLSVGGSTTTLSVGGTFTETQGNFTAPATLNVTGDLTLTSGTFTAGTLMTEAGNWINNGGTFIPGTGTITFTGNLTAIKGTALTQAFNNIVVNKTSGLTMIVGGSTTTLSVGGTFIETLGNFTAPAILNVAGDLTLTSGTLTAGTTLTESGNWINNGGTFAHNGGTVTFNGNGARTVNSGGSPFNNFTLTNSGGTCTALSNGITIAGTFTTYANTTLDMGTNVLSTNNVAHAGTLYTQNLTSSPITAGKSWGGTVNYNAAKGGQTVMAGTYAILTLGNTNGLQTASGNIMVTTLNNNTDPSDILNMGIHTLGVTAVNNSGIIRTQNISSAPLYNCLNWGGTVDYNAASGGQTLMEGTYDNLILSNTSGIQSASTDLTVNGTLTTTSGGTLDMRTFQLLETTGTVINKGTIATQNTSSTPIPLDKTWDGEILYNGTSPQTVVTGTYKDLTIDNAPGVFLSDTIKTGNVTGKLWIKNGKRLEIGTKAEMIAASIQNDAGTSGILIKAGSNLANGTLIFSGPAPQASVEMYSKASWNLEDPNPDNRYNWQFFGIPVQSVVANPTFNGSYVRKWDESGTTTSNYWLQLGNGSVLSSFLGYELCQESPTTLVFKGQLENSNFDSGPMSYTPNAIYHGQHIFANPYTAAIDVRKLDFGTGTEATVYLYNVGSFSQWTTGGQISPVNDPGQYTAIPKIPAGDLGIPYEVPSMQAMLVKAMSNSSNATFGINYHSVITKNTVQQRVKASNEPASTDKVCTVIDVKGTHYSDRMWIFTDPACSHRFNNGWDGAKLLGSALSPQLYAMETDGNYQVDAVEDMNNTKLGFLPGADVSYIFIFTHSNTEKNYAGIYLRDNVENKTVDITESGSVYSFVAGSSPQMANRFMIITRPYEKNAPDNDSSLKIFTGINSILIQNVSSLDGEVMIYDIAGHYLKKVSLSRSSITTVTGIMPGAYVAKAFTGKDGVTKRLIVQ